MTFGKTLSLAALFAPTLLMSATALVYAQAPYNPLPVTPPSTTSASQPPDASAKSASQTPSAEQKPAGEKKHGFQIPKIGIDYDIFLPSSGKTRSRFGKSWGGIGFGIGRPDRPSGSGRISLDFSTQYQHSGDHHAFAAPIGISYRRAFNAGDLEKDAAGVGHTFIPYYGVSADLVVVDLRSPQDDVHSRFRLSEGGSVLIGTTIGASGFVEGKYTGIAKVQGFDLSGIKLSVGVRF